MTTYALDLQKAVFDLLQSAAVADGRVLDHVPADTPLPYVSFGPSDETGADADCIEAVEIAQQIDVWSAGPGFPECKRLASEIRALLHRKTLVVGSTGIEIEIRTIRFLRDRDGLTSHAAIDLRALVERE